MDGHSKTAEQRTIIQHRLRWLVHYGWAVTFGTAMRGLAVPNLTSHPSTASVLTSYYSMWHYNCLWVWRVKQTVVCLSSRHSQPTSFTTSHSTSPDRTMLPAQHFWSSGLLCRWSDGLELATGQSPRPSAQQQQLQTIADDEPISTLLVSTHSAVEMAHDSESSWGRSPPRCDIDKRPER